MSISRSCSEQVGRHAVYSLSDISRMCNTITNILRLTQWRYAKSRNFLVHASKTLARQNRNDVDKANMGANVSVMPVRTAR